MANMIGRLGVSLALNAAEFVTGIENAGKKLEQFAESAEHYSKYAATAMLAMSYAAIKLADDIADVAQANDVAIDTVVKLRAALDASGGSADKAGVMLSAFTKFIDTAASGSFEAQKAFKAVGISLKDIGTLSQEELLGKALKGLENIEDQITRGARAMDLFTKAAKGVAFGSFAQEMQQATATAKEQAEAIKLAAQSYDALAKIGNELNIMLATKIGPTLKTTIDYFNNLKDVFNLVGSVFKVTFQTVAIVGANVVYVIKGIAFEVKAMYEFINNLATKGLATAIAKNDEYVKSTIRARKELDDFERQILKGTPQQGGAGRGMLGYEAYANTGTGRETTVGIDTKAEALRAKQEAERKRQEALAEAALKRQLSLMEKGYAEERRAIQESANEWDKYKDEQAKAAQSQSEYFRLSQQQLERDREMTLLEKTNLNLRSYELDYAKQILSIRNKYADRIYEIERNENLTREKKEEFMEREIELRDRSISQAREVLDLTRNEMEGSFQKGFGKGFDEFIRNMPNQLELGRQAFNSLFGSMDAALENFVRNGKFNFGDFTRSVLQNMILIQARAQMMSMMKGVWSMFGGGTPSVSLGEAYGGGTAGAVGFSHANGGSPTVGVPNLVGERGPELFIPSQSGMIIPNNNLASAMGGGQTINYNGPYIANMSAIDTQSGAQFLAKNKQAVWATYQSANRSVPVTR